MPGPIVPVPRIVARFSSLMSPFRRRWSLALLLLDPAPDALGGQRKLVHRDAGVRERADDRRGHRRQRALAAALGAVWARAVGVLDDDRASSRPAGRATRGTRYSSRLSLSELAVDEPHLLEQRVADALHRRALVLALDELRVDRLADVGDGGGAQHGDDARVRVDLDLRRRRRRPPRSAGPSA